jgi:hypothetical protein
MQQPSLYTPEVYDRCLARLDRLAEDTKPGWGTMTPAQMLAHCAEVQEVANGSRELSGTPLPLKLLGPLIRRAVVSDRPYPKDARTHPQYRQREERDFDAEKQRLLSALEAFRRAEDAPPARHPLFGTLDHDERGRSSYKHLDHHLRQFGL